MLTATPVKFSHSALTATLNTVLYTAPTKVILKQILLANTSASPVAVTISAGATSDVADRVIPATEISGNSTTILSLNTILNAGDTITGGAGTAAVVGCSLSGITLS